MAKLKTQSSLSTAICLLLVLVLTTAGCQRATAPSPESNLPFDPAVTPRILWPREDYPVTNNCQLESGEYAMTWMASWTPVQGATGYHYRVVPPNDILMNKWLATMLQGYVSATSLSSAWFSSNQNRTQSLAADALEGWTVEVRAKVDGAYGPWASQEFSFSSDPFTSECNSPPLVSVVASTQVLVGQPVAVEFSAFNAHLQSSFRGIFLESSDMQVEVVRSPAGSTAATTLRRFGDARLASFVPDLPGDYAIRVSTNTAMVGTDEVVVNAVASWDELDAQDPGLVKKSGRHLIPSFVAVDGPEGLIWGMQEYLLEAPDVPVSIALLDDVIVAASGTRVWDLTSVQLSSVPPGAASFGGTSLVYSSLVVPNTSSTTDGSLRPASAAIGSRWPGARIPYEPNLPESMPQAQVDAVKAAIEIINSQTVLTLEPRTEDDRDYVNFVAVSGRCASALGRRGGPQSVLLDPTCPTSTIVHELLHAAGVIHEHQRDDRDEHVTIDYDNITPEFAPAYRKMSEWSMREFAGAELLTDYDFNSIMHYGSSYFAIDKSLPNLVRLDGSTDLGGFELTALDIEGLAQAYRSELPTWELIEPSPSAARTYTVAVGSSATLWVEIQNTSSSLDASALEVELSESLRSGRRAMTIPTGESSRTSFPLPCTSEGVEDGFLRILSNSPFSKVVDVRFRLSCTPRVNSAPVVESLLVQPATADIDEDVTITASFSDDTDGPFECLFYVDGAVRDSSADCPNPYVYVVSFSNAGVHSIGFFVRDSDDASDSRTGEILVVNKRDQSLDTCDVWSVANSGGDGITEDLWDISVVPDDAVIDIRYDTFSIPDRIRVDYPSGEEVFASGWRGDASYEGDPLYPEGIAGPPQGEVLGVFTKSPTPTSFAVQVEGRDPSTAWEYSVRCRTP